VSSPSSTSSPAGTSTFFVPDEVNAIGWATVAVPLAKPLAVTLDALIAPAPVRVAGALNARAPTPRPVAFWRLRVPVFTSVSAESPDDPETMSVVPAAISRVAGPERSRSAPSVTFAKVASVPLMETLFADCPRPSRSQ
jgi:hypothetical protein